MVAQASRDRRAPDGAFRYRCASGSLEDPQCRSAPSPPSCSPPGRSPRADLFPASLTADTWQGRLYAMPWFLDVGMLYWRTDLSAAPPATLAALADAAGGPRRETPRYGFVWQGARYEGLVTVFLEVLTAFGG